MAGPWEKYGQQGQVVSLPPDPMQQAAAAREEARLKLAQEAASRAERAANKPNLPVGWEMGPNGQARRIPGLPQNADTTTPRISAKERADAIQGYTDATALERIADNIEAQFQTGPGATKGLRGLQDYLPTPSNRKFNDTGFQARGFVKRALGFTGGEGNTIGEISLNYGPYLPEAGDYDEQIVNKIAALRGLAEQSRNRAIAVLGGIPDANGNITPVDPNASVRGPQMQTGGKSQDKMDPETSRQIDAMIYAGRSNDDIIAFAKSKGYPPPSNLDAARAYLKANPGYSGGFTQAIQRTPVADNFGLKTLGIDPNSGLGAYAAASANALTAGTLDELAGGNAQQAKELLRQQYPGASFGGDITGSALGMGGLNAGFRFAGGRLAGLATRGGGIGGDMLYGGAFGAGESNDDRLKGALAGGAAAGAGNLVGRGIVAGAGRGVRGVSDPAVNYLAERGIRLSPGQVLGQSGAFGKGLHLLEDAFESIPGVGAAIRTRKTEGVRDLNREAFKDALAPIDGQVQGTVGQDAIGEGRDLVSDAYASSLNGKMMRADSPFAQEAIQAYRMGSSVPTMGDQFDYLVRNKIGPLFLSNRRIDGPGFQAALQTTKKAAKDFSGQGAMGNEAAGFMGDLGNAFVGLAERQAPGTIPGLNAANQAYRNLSILGDAINSAGHPEGLVTAKQLSRAAVNNTKKFGGRGAAARGDVPFSELTSAASKVMPNELPNSGTADRAIANVILPGALGGAAAGSEYFNLPAPVTATLGGLGLLYTRKGNEVAQALLTSRNPKIRQFGEEIVKRARLGGMFGGATTLPYAVNP